MTIMKLMEARLNEADKIIDIHKNARMIDDRYAITKAEKEKAIQKYFTEDGELSKFPKKEKEKIIVLIKIMESFEHGVQYTEKDVNAVLEKKYNDYVLIRRYLIEYGFIDRKRDGSYYWAVF